MRYLNHFFVVLPLILFLSNLNAQSNITGVLLDYNKEPILYGNVEMYSSMDSIFIKVGASDENGFFTINDIPSGNYFLKASYIGLPEFVKTNILLKDGETKDLGVLIFEEGTVTLGEAEVTGERSMVVVEPDRTVFNVQGTINSVGADAIALLRKAPGVVIDNNDNINVLGRSGVRVYVDGKVLPLNGDDLSNYLKNLSADQIDRIDIITSPGAKYEAEGNAGIIDIILVKDDRIGAYGSIGTTFTKGELYRYNVNANGNFRNKYLNVFASGGYNVNDNFHNINFESYQNGLFLDEINNTTNERDVYRFRVGTDFYLNKKSTLGFMIGNRVVDGNEIGYNRIAVSDQNTISNIDSVLVANNDGTRDRKQNTYNLNYRFSEKSGKSLNIDLDFGKFNNEVSKIQPNQYFDAAEEVLFSENKLYFETPNDIEIYTVKADYEQKLGKGKFGFGGKFGNVSTENIFNVYDVIGGNNVFDDTLSNQFSYKENVTAGYLTYSSKLSEKWSLASGLRAEYTETDGQLKAFISDLEEENTNNDYLSWFPNLGLTYNMKQGQSLAFNYGRRINRPDYNVLNPFRNQLSELSIEKGNPNLKPEIVNNVELGYTLAYRFNFKLAYSKTDDKITRLIGPDDSDPKAGFISWDNLATETVISFNASLPFQVKKWWSSYFNLGASHIDNQADYGDAGKVDVQQFSYTIYQQSSFTLPKGFKAELSGYYSGPGVWGGVFVYDANWSIDAGLQKELMKKKLKVRLSMNNIFNQIGWQGTSEFNGLSSTGNGRWDARFVSLSLKYSIGNQKSASKDRESGLEKESKRAGS